MTAFVSWRRPVAPLAAVLLALAAAVPASTAWGQLSDSKLTESNAAPAAADDDGRAPVAVLALSGYDALLADADFIGELLGRPAVSQMVEGLLAFTTGGRGLEGLDKSRPLGVVLQTDGMAFAPVACLPIADPTPLIEIGENLGVAPRLGEDGVYELEVGEQTVYFFNEGAWTFVAQTVDALDSAPEDPAALLGGLVAQYDIGIQADVQNVPAMYRQIAVEQLRQGMEEGLEQEDDESDEDFDKRRELATLQVDQLASLIEDLDRVLLGVNIDGAAKQVYLDTELSGVPGSDLALGLSVYEGATCEVAAFHRPDAAASLLGIGDTPPELLEKQAAQVDAQIELARNQLRQGIDEAFEKMEEEGLGEAKPGLRDAVEDALNELLSVYADVLRGGHVEVAGSLDLAGEGYDLIAAAYVKDGPRVESALKKLATTAAEGEPDAPEFEWDYGSHAGVTLHGLTFPLPDGADELRAAAGDSVRLTLGVGAERVYLALGPRGETALKRAIDNSMGGPVDLETPAEVLISLGEVLRVVEGFAPAEASALADLMLGAIEQGDPSADRLVFRTQAVESGVRLRYLLEEGVLRAIGRAAAYAAEQQMAQQGMPGGF
ncbi:MAG: hypothetical protein AAF842_11290 [Planctomycetota bacterium]